MATEEVDAESETCVAGVESAGCAKGEYREIEREGSRGKTVRFGSGEGEAAAGEDVALLADVDAPAAILAPSPSARLSVPRAAAT